MKLNEIEIDTLSDYITKEINIPRIKSNQIITNQLNDFILTKISESEDLKGIVDLGGKSYVDQYIKIKYSKEISEINSNILPYVSIEKVKMDVITLISFKNIVEVVSIIKKKYGRS